MDQLNITRDERGYVQVDAVHAASLLGLLITDDLGGDIDSIEDVLAALAAIRAGTADRYEQVWNATRLVIDPAGARLTWAMNVSENTPELVSLDTLSAALGQLRRLVSSD